MRSVAIAVICGSIGFALSYFILPKKGEVRYNCDMAEFHPDFPLEARQKCRELRSIK